MVASRWNELVSGRVGPYEVVREIVRGPGATLAEARDPGGERRLLQLVSLRAVDGELERAERHRHERQIAQRTAELVTEGELTLHAHGGIDLIESGERLLFWVLPWIEGTFFLERAKERPLVVGEVIRVAWKLAERMAVRHQASRVDPLLAEHFLYGGAEETIDLAGVPVAALSQWLGREMLQPRLAPEEERTEDRRASGDLWRLGGLLGELARLSDPLSAEVKSAFDALAEPDVGRRAASATQAVATFERIWTARAEGQSAVFAELLSFPTKTSSRVASNGVATGSPAIDPAASPEATLPDPLAVVSWDIPASVLPDREEAVVLGFDPEAVTKQAEPLTPVPAVDAAVTLIDQDRIEPVHAEAVKGGGAERPASAAPAPTPGEEKTVEPVERVKQIKPAEAKPPPATLAAASVHDRFVDTFVEEATWAPAIDAQRAAATERVEAHAPSARGEFFERTPPPRSNSAKPRAASGNGHALSEHPIDPIAASWAQPVLPSGESPWSEVLQPRGTQQRDRSAFPGFSEEIPVPARSEDRPAISRPEPPVFDATSDYKDVPTGEIQVEIAAALRGVNAKKIVSAVLMLLVMFGLFALFARSSGRSAEREVRIATPANEVTLESDPPGATVVAEADGAILGKTPLRFLVPPGSMAGVFLSTAGREPLRVTLPERGGITAKLVAVEEGPCEVKLVTAERVDLEGIDAEVGTGALRKIPGAALVRARTGQRLRGARLVLCPALGGKKEQDLSLERKGSAVQVRLTQPDGAAAIINGESVGNVPVALEAQPGFSRVQVSDLRGNSEERWVATLSPTEVRMPIPRPQPIQPASDSEPGAKRADNAGDGERDRAGEGCGRGGCEAEARRSEARRPEARASVAHEAAPQDRHEAPQRRPDSEGAGGAHRVCRDRSARGGVPSEPRHGLPARPLHA